MGTLCHYCDLWVGYGALGVMAAPRNQDHEWLAVHCWGCGRHADVVAANPYRLSEDPKPAKDLGPELSTAG